MSVLAIFGAFAMGFLRPTDSCTLVSNKKAVSSIIIPTKEPSPNEAEHNFRAAQLLQSSVEKISGCRLQIIRKDNFINENAINIGFPESRRKRASVRPEPQSLLKPDGFAVYSKGTSLSIASGGKKGSIYGVIHLLEKYFGCRCYSPSYYVFPPRSDLRISKINDVENPAVAYRAVNGDFSKDPDYLVWNRGNTTTEMYGLGYAVHTYNKLVPTNAWFESHPEYFALINNRRSAVQLCPSNPELVPIIVQKLKQEMAAQPTKHVWSVSQNDNESYCQCPACLVTNRQEGSPSGAQLRLINEIAKKFPNETISTLAYQWSRKAPKITRPEKNVQIVLCTIEADRAQPIETNPTTADFVRDISNWHDITKNIYLWDYTVNFNHFLAPFPNLFTLQPNVEFFVKYGVNQIFEQTNTAPGHEFSELKAYLLAKLMWNPKAEVLKIIHDFCMGYYGPGGQYIEQYIYNISDVLRQSKTRLDIFDSPVKHANDYLSERHLDEYGASFFLATAATQDPTQRQHIFTAQLSLSYARLLIASNDVFGPRGFYKLVDGKPIATISIPGTFDQFLDTAQQNNVKSLNERNLTPTQFCDSLRRLTNLNIAGNIAFGSKIKSKPEPSKKYGGGIINKLTNGVQGGPDFHSEWIGWDGVDFELSIDLGSKRTLSTIETNSLSEFGSWILHPDKVECFVSEDGKGFLPWGSEALESSHKAEPGRHHFNFPNPLGPYEHGKFQYVLIRVTGAKKLPQWHPSAGGSAWVFLDEIIVR